MNKCILTGRLAKDPARRSTPNGKDTTTFTIAVNRNYKNQNGEYDADFINCVAWGNTAVFISNYFKKGSGIHIVGSIQTRSYDNKEGIRCYVTEINVSEAEFCGTGKSESKPVSKPTHKPAPEPEDLFGEELSGFIPSDDDELPF